jgi:hypothetical protein
MRFSYPGSAGSMSPSRMGCLHLGHGPNVRGCGGGFRSDSGICTLEEEIRTSGRQSLAASQKSAARKRLAIAAALRRGAVVVLDGRIPVPHRTGRNSRRTPGSARNVRLCLLAFDRDQQATWRRDKNGRHGSRVGPIVAAAAAWRSPSPAGARTVPVLFADYWVTRLCRARILRPSRN